MRARPGIVLLSVLLLASSSAAIAAETPRSILVLEQSDVRGPFYAGIFAGIRAAVNQSTTGPVTLYVENLDLIRFRSEAYERSLRDHFAVKYKDHPIGAIVTVGSAALDYSIRWRAELWPDAPVVFAFVDEAAFAGRDLPADVTGLLTRLSLADMVGAARAVVPDLGRVAIVGDSLDAQPVFGHFRNELADLSPGLEVVDLTGLRMTDLKERVATLPEDSAILYTAIYSDGAGTYFPPADAVAMVAEVANRPIIAPAESYIGRGAVGGNVAVPAVIGEEAGKLALRIIDGENAEDLPVGVGNAVRPIFEWPELMRWRVDPAMLPLGSEVRNRIPTLWEEYAWEISAIAVVLILQTGLIIGLFHEHGRRRRAEVEARQRLGELTHVNRRATVGEFSSTIAHELNQPLGAILNNAGAAERLLAGDSPDLGEIGRVLGDIKRDNARASDVIARVRRLVSKAPAQTQALDIDHLVREVFEFMRPQALAEGVFLEQAPRAGKLVVLGDSIQLQQVVLNLALNAIESVASRSDGDRRGSGRTRPSGIARVEVEIVDSGPGVSADRLAAIFEPFVTTKGEGMGMGLSIARSIVEAHGGRIWAENRRAGGAAFHFTLPLAVQAEPSA